MVRYGYLSCLLCMLHFPLVGPFLLQALALHQTPGSLRVLHTITAVASTALFWTEILDVFGGICWSHSSQPQVPQWPGEPLLSSLPTSSPATLSVTGISPVPSSWCCCRFSITCLSVCIWKSPRIVLHHLWRCVPHWPGGFQSKLGPNVPVHYNSYLVIAFHVCKIDISESS